MGRLLPGFSLLFVALGLSACGSSPASPSLNLTGTWAEQFSIPGPSLIVTVDNSGNGTGTYAIEAGRSGTLLVTGTVTSTTITLVIVYDYGLVQTFTGTLTDPNHLVGVFTSGAGQVTFSRR